MPRRSKRLQGSPAPQEQPVETAKRRRTARGVSPQPWVVIDHTAFPHIVEAIILSSSPDVLLAFRQTCRAFQALVDDFLPRSITFNPDGKALPFPREDACLDFIRVLDTRMWTSLERPQLEDFNDTDICSCKYLYDDIFHPYVDFARVGRHLNNVKIVRRGDSSCLASIVQAETFVTFCDWTLWESLQDAYIPYIGYQDHLRDFDHKDVFHFICNTHQPLRGLPTWSWCDEELPCHAREVVTILSRGDFGRCVSHGPFVDEYPRNYAPEDSLIYRVVDMVSDAIFPRENPPTVTFVDVESWNNTWNAWPPKRSPVRMSDIIKDMLVDVFFSGIFCLGDPPCFPSREEARAYLDNDARLFFPTLDEYRDQVGHEQFALEMGKGWRSESGWTGKPN